MRIAVIHNQPVDAAEYRAAEWGVVEQAASVVSALVAAGHTPIPFAATDASALCEFLSRNRPELIFNCCESLAGRARFEMNVAAIFELYGISFTGSSALSLGLALDKGLSKAVFAAQGVPTPLYMRFESDADATVPGFSFPLIVKPVAEDASIGIDDGAVVHDAAALEARLRFVWRTFDQAALVEEFIAGREFNVSLLATSPWEFRVLPIAEIEFDELPRGRPRIVGYEAKWSEGSAAYRGTTVQCPALLDADTAARIGQAALAAARAVGMRDYGRIDLRVRESDQAVFVLEANPNPDIGPQAGFLRAAAAAGIGMQEVILEIVNRTIERCARSSGAQRFAGQGDLP